jgi:type IV pilus assembly protein PilQ
MEKLHPVKERLNFPNLLESFKMLDINTKLYRPLRVAVILFSSVILIAGCATQQTANVKSAEETKLITDIVTSEDAESTIVTLKGGPTLIYTANKQVFPLGVLFHFPETALDNIKEVYYPPQTDIIGSIRATQIEENGATSRVFIALKRDLPYSITPDETGIRISFPKTGKLAEKTSAPEPPAEKMDEQPKPEKKMAAAATRITAIGTTPLKKSVVINVKADGTIKNYKSFTIEETPARIVYDLYGIKSPYKDEQRIAVKSDKVTRVRHFGHSDKVRVVIETQKPYLSKYGASPVDNGLLIYVGQTPPAASQASAKAADVPQKKTAAAVAEKPSPTETEPTVAPDKKAAAPSEKPATETTAAKFDQPAWLNRIDFSSEEAGKSAVLIGTTRPVEYQVAKVADKRIQLKLMDTSLPEYRKRALITTRFQSAVDRVTPTHQPKTKDTIVEFELREAVPYFVKQTDNVIRVNFSPSSIPPRPYEDAKLPAWKRVMAEPSADPGKTPPKAAGPATIAAVADKEQKIAQQGSAGPAKEEERSLAERLAIDSPGQKYTGEKIALDFYNTDIKNVFRIIREISGKNFAIDKNVTGKVTLTLEKPVPWDQVLDLVLKMNALGMVMEDDIIRIATRKTIIAEEKEKQAVAKAQQLAVEQQKELQPLITEFIPINYSDAGADIKPHIDPILTKRGKVSVDKRNNQLILTAIAENIERAKEIIVEIDKVTAQVTIEARIVEANTSFSRALGFDWGRITIGSVGNPPPFFGGTPIYNPLEVGDSALDFTALASNLPAVANGSLGFNIIGTDFSIVDAKLEAAESEGKTNIISSPKITTLDSKQATIIQGLQVPYLERDSSGNSTTKYQDVDLKLTVTPKITLDDRIRLKVVIQKQDIVEQTQFGPAVSNNTADTELLVDNGDTIVIGGIVKSTLTYDEDGIPGLMQMGVLGWLFKSQAKVDNKNELLIFMTPRIVKLEQKSAGH